MSKETSTKQLTEILVQAIREEPYFSKDVLIPKVRAIISGFRLRLASINYNAIKDPSETAKLIRSNELHNLEKDFWKQELKKTVGNEKMDEYYSKLDEQRLIWNGTEHCRYYCLAKNGFENCKIVVCECDEGYSGDASVSW